MSHRVWRFHHVGVATRSAESFVRRFADVSDDISNEFSDPLQGVVGKFIRLGDMQVEVLEPLGGDPTLEPWLEGGNRAYQIAFEVEDLDTELETARRNKVRIVREPHSAVAFGGRRVAFLMPVPGLLIELIETA